MNTPPNDPRFVILAAIDDSASGLNVAQVGVNLAKTIPGGELHLVHVVNLARDVDPSLPLEQAREYLESTAMQAQAGWDGRILGHVSAGGPAHEILQMASRLSADLVLVGCHGRKGIPRLVLGSVAELVVRRASCPVLVVRPKDYHGHVSPSVEPPCPDCLAAQAKSRGETLWCARHSEHHPRPHVHYRTPEPFALGASIIRPDERPH